MALTKWFFKDLRRYRNGTPLEVAESWYVGSFEHGPWTKICKVTSMEPCNRDHTNCFRSWTWPLTKKIIKGTSMEPDWKSPRWQVGLPICCFFIMAHEIKDSFGVPQWNTTWSHKGWIASWEPGLPQKSLLTVHHSTSNGTWLEVPVPLGFVVLVLTWPPDKWFFKDSAMEHHLKSQS